MKFKIDLHTHSTLSYDGGISADQYSEILTNGALDYVAVTDHNEVDFALEMQQIHGDKIIVGEEIRSDAGDVIGLFLDRKIEKGLSLRETVMQIKSQGGLVYIPHPFDRLRSGLKLDSILSIIGMIDIIEIFNARYIFPGGNRSAKYFAQSAKRYSCAVGSDSHSRYEIGRTFNLVDEKPSKDNLTSLLKPAKIEMHYTYPWLLLMPKINKLKKRLNAK